MPAGDEYPVPIISVTVTVKPKNGAQNLKKWKAQLICGADNSPAAYNLTNLLVADANGVVVMKPNTNLPAHAKLFIDLLVNDGPYGVSVRQDIGRPQKDLDVCFVLVPVGEETGTTRKRRPSA